MFDERLDTAPADEALHDWSSRMEALFAEAPTHWQTHWIREKAKTLQAAPKRDLPRTADPTYFPEEAEAQGSGLDWTQVGLLLLMILAWAFAIMQFGKWQGWW